MKDYKESDIEAAFCDYINQDKFQRVIGRQIRLPFGILDVLAVAKDAANFVPIVCEIKRGKIDLSSVGQLFGYIAQINFLVWDKVYAAVGDNTHVSFRMTEAVLVGASIEPRALRIVLAMGARFVRYHYIDGKFSFDEPYQEFYIGEENPVYDDRAVRMADEIVEYHKQKLTKELQDPRRFYENFDRPVSEVALNDGFTYWKAK